MDMQYEIGQVFYWGEYAAGGKEAIPLLRQGLRWNEMEAKRLLRVPRFMPIDEWNVAEGLKWKNEHLKIYYL